MSTTSFNPRDSEQRKAKTTGKVRGVIVWSSLLFAVLQSVCTFFAAVDGFRLAIGIGALVVGGVAGSTMHWLHSDMVRVPMVALALAGSLLNLVVLWQVRRLRAAPAAQWRVTSPSPRKIRLERMQFLLSILTLALVGVEEYWHFTWHHHF
ncbi:hypothetical protein [Acidicapsa ligni]|uniref:hypothetical protein n=1 Tax=Acidicapsa ligni TaxID=542300 RepID=UPI0021E06437|nr:hypothetical protein [Acidicapsa ligni]